MPKRHEQRAERRIPADVGRDTHRVRAIRRRLLRWYGQNRRDLPWRRNPSPYAVWVSETMLQQTQVGKVVGYFERFMSRFPTLESLAAAPLEEVLRVWEGLGYYRRAVHLWQAARMVVDQFGGEIPQDLAMLQSLPGVGRYTAGAILSIGFGKPAPILEANSRRVLSRVFAGVLPADQNGDSRLWDLAAKLVPRSRPGDFNQALMELGSTVCTLRQPQCLICPLAKLCDFAAGKPSAGPTAKPQQFEHQSVVVAVARSPCGVLLWRYGPEERWAYLWDFPRFRLADGADPLEQAQRGICEIISCAVVAARHNGVIHHAVTRFRIRAEVVVLEVEVDNSDGVAPSSTEGTSSQGDGRKPAVVYRLAGQEFGSGPVGKKGSDKASEPIHPGQRPKHGKRILRWFKLPELDQLPMPAPSRRIARMILQDGGLSGTT